MQQVERDAASDFKSGYTSGVASQPRAHKQKICTGPPKWYGLQLG